ncbi:MAG TPA: hypothetical protein VNZ68_01305 [Rhodocyclaceae bacterium]|nr:hypothetical protein [Rhodocyclaceae bacterium]
MKLPHFLLFCACVSASAIALAQNHGRAAREDRDSFAPPNDFGRERPERMERLERPERIEVPRDPREQMSVEERRQLRRDVNDAGREIYRRPDRY